MKLIPVVLLLLCLGFGQSAKVVPVDSKTAANLAVLEKQSKDAKKAYDDAVEEAKRKILTTRSHVNPTAYGHSCTAFREGEDRTGLSITSLFLGTTSITYNSNCETAAEKAERARLQKVQAAEEEKWESEHPQRYWLEGFCDGAVFTDDYRYLVPKHPEPAVNHNPIFNWSSPTPLQGSIQ